MFSSTTIESSTRMPTLTVSATIVSRLRLKSRAFIRTSVTRIETGMETSTMTVERQVCRKRSRIRPVMTTASRRAVRTDDLVDREAAPAELRLVDQDVDLADDARADGGRADPAQRVEPRLDDVLGELLQPRQRLLAGEHDRHDALGGGEVELRDRRRL